MTEATKIDGELLADHVQGVSTEAFRALVERHGAMVHAACSRLLGHHDAEDAAQAVFLLLVRRAPKLTGMADIGAWLHRAAWYVARTAKRERVRRTRREREAAAMRETGEAAQDAAWRRISPHLDEAVEALPGRYREVVTLCYLEGRTQQEAAQLLRKSQGTVASLCARALEKLRARLGRKGVTVAGAVLGTALVGRSAEAGAIPAGFASSVEAALGSTGASQASLLAGGAAKAMLWAKAKVWLAVAVAAMVLGVSAPFVAGRPNGDAPLSPVVVEEEGLPAETVREAEPQAEPVATETETGAGNVVLQGVAIDGAGRPIAGARAYLFVPRRAQVAFGGPDILASSDIGREDGPLFDSFLFGEQRDTVTVHGQERLPPPRTPRMATARQLIVPR